MNNTNTPIDVYLEVGAKKTFAGSIAWPGWCRWGRDEASALQDLLHYGPRYALVLDKTQLGFNPPRDVSQFEVVERLTGNKTTDFGAPDIAPSSDSRPMEKDELQRFGILLKACWEAFDSSIEAASGKELRKGPRGGGRDLEGVIRHVMGAEAGYLSRLAYKHKVDEGGNLSEELDKLRKAILDTLASAQRGELPERGPRGGVIWKPRYFVRRVAWHVLDHAWELEDRILDHS
jgi:hypothetical protein